MPPVATVTGAGEIGPVLSEGSWAQFGLRCSEVTVTPMRCWHPCHLGDVDPVCKVAGALTYPPLRQSLDREAEAKIHREAGLIFLENVFRRNQGIKEDKERMNEVNSRVPVLILCRKNRAGAFFGSAVNQHLLQKTFPLRKGRVASWFQSRDTSSYKQMNRTRSWPQLSSKSPRELCRSQ